MEEKARFVEKKMSVINLLMRQESGRVSGRLLLEMRECVKEVYLTECEARLRNTKKEVPKS